MRPALHFEKPELEALHGVAFRNALHNLLVTNTVPDVQKQYNRTGLFNERFGLFEGPPVLCDGIAGYPEPPYDPKVSSSFILDLHLEGEGQHIASVVVDGKTALSAFLSAKLTGEHQVTIRLRAG